MEKVMQRHLVVADRETLMITFERKVPEDQREQRASRVIDDVIDAEEYAKKQGTKAALGTAALVGGIAALNSLNDNK
jgi:hypothetical protein